MSKPTFIYAIRNKKTGKFETQLTSRVKKFWERRSAAEDVIKNVNNKYYHWQKPEDLELATFEVTEVKAESIINTEA